MSWVANRAWVQELAQSIDKSAKVTTKDHWFWRMLGSILAFFHLMTKQQFLENYATTLGPIQAYPASWDLETVRQVCVHESEHTRQCRLCGFGLSPYLGLPIMGLLYGLFFFPVGLAWFRYRFELGASRKEWQWMLRHGIREEVVRNRAMWFAATVSSSAYGWPWPRTWTLRGFDKAFQEERLAFLRWSSRIAST
jgi:hypothetical protein